MGVFSTMHGHPPARAERLTLAFGNNYATVYYTKPLRKKKEKETETPPTCSYPDVYGVPNI
jgi:hypothetical protein